jgi:hypothetical protein
MLETFTRMECAKRSKFTITRKVCYIFTRLIKFNRPSDDLKSNYSLVIFKEKLRKFQFVGYQQDNSFKLIQVIVEIIKSFYFC